MHVKLNNMSFYYMLWRRIKISMCRKLLIVFTVTLLAAVFILPAAAQCAPFGGCGLGGFGGCGLGGFGGCGLGGFGGCGLGGFGGPFGGCGYGGWGPFGSSYSTGFTTASTYSSGFTTVNGYSVPYGGCGCGPFW